MNILNYMKDDIVIITPACLKEKVIKEISLLDKMYSYKIFSEKELKKNLFFDYDLRAIDYLVKQYQLKIEVAQEYLNNLYYIENKNYRSKKLKDLLKIKNDLLVNNLLIIDKSFLDVIANKEIYVYGFDVINKELKMILSNLNKPYQVINEYDKTIPKQRIYHFQTLEEEVDYVCFQISSLLNSSSKVNINKIKIANVNNDYYFTLKRYFRMYNIPLFLNENSSLYDKLCVKDFLNKVKENYNLKESLEYFKIKYPEEKNIYYLLIDICNKFLVLDIKNSFDIFKYLIKKTNSNNKHFKNVVEIISLDDYFIKNDEYIFVLSINQGIYPKVYKNEDFLNDYEKEELGLDTSEELNILAKEKFKIMLNKSSNLFLSYKDSSPFNNYSKSFILNELFESEEFFDKKFEYSFSRDVDRLTLAKIYDKMENNAKYENSDKSIINKLSYNYPDLEYKTYDHKFKKFSNNLIKEYFISEAKSMSYSAISNYFSCAFKYYLTNILDLESISTTKSIDIGNVFHKVLELSFQDNFDFDMIYENQLNKIEDVITKFYLKKFKNTLKDIIKINHQYFDNSSLKKVLTEQIISVKYEKPISVVFKGIIDKILYNQESDGKKYLAIIDYKTGNPEIDISKIKYGLSLQLPIYLYLLKHSNEFKDANVCGFYLQKLIPQSLKVNSDYYNCLIDDIALQGYSNSSLSILSRFEPNYSSSQMISGFKILKSGDIAKNSKVLSSQEMAKIADEVEDKILEAIEEIFKCNFDINPKKLNNKNQSCTYCIFKDCCFMDYSDFKYLKDNEDDIKD